jgi:PAS domain S-box-containing protein
MRPTRPFTTPTPDASAAHPAPAPAPAPAPPPTAVDYPQDLVFIVARDGKILYVNQTLGGVEADQAIGQSVYDWIAEEQHLALREALEGVFAAGERRGIELARLPRHVPEAWYECRLSPTLRGGDVVSATLIARDITRHKLALEELNRRRNEIERRYRERETDLARAQAQLAEALAARDADGPMLHRFRALLDAAGEAIFITDAATGAITDLNGTASRWLRRQREELLGRTAEELGLEFVIHVAEDQDVSFTETRDSRRPRIIAGGVHRRRDGSTFPVEVAVARHTWGKEECQLAVVRDVKEREHSLALLRQRESAYNDLFEQSWDGIYLTARSGHVVAANPAVAELLGYTRDELAGLDARVLLPRAADVRSFQDALAAQGVVRNLEIELRRKDGTVLPALLSATRRYSSEGTIQGHQCLIRARPVPTTVEPPAPAPPRPAVPPVLVLDPDDALRAETLASLHQAGVPALEAGGMPRAIDLLRDHAGAITAVVMAVEAGERGADLTVEEFRRIDPAVPIIITSKEDRLVLAEQLADLEISAFLDRPAHPLALVQRIRALAAQR